MQTQPTYDPILRQHEVLAMLRVTRSTLWKWRRFGWFPHGFPINERGDLGWQQSEVLAWMSARSAGQLPHLPPTRVSDNQSAGLGADSDAQGPKKRWVNSRVQKDTFRASTSPHRPAQTRTKPNEPLLANR